MVDNKERTIGEIKRQASRNGVENKKNTSRAISLSETCLQRIHNK